MNAVGPAIRDALDFLDRNIEYGCRVMIDLAKQVAIVAIRAIGIIAQSLLWLARTIWERPSEFDRPPNIFNRAAHENLAVDDGPVNLGPLRLALRMGYDVPISERMTVRDFITLIDEFPREQTRIGRWAQTWASRRPIQIDPEHPYFEIFQELFQRRQVISGGTHASPNWRDYSVADEQYMYGSKFAYIVNNLIGFQEMSREENRELFRKLDNRRSSFDQNPAYQYARALSKIFVYPTALINGWGRMDIPDKLQIGIGAPLEAFRAAQEENKITEFFLEGFDHHMICFDARVNKLQEFMMSIVRVGEFSPDIRPDSTVDERILEHYRVFVNLQARKLAQELRKRYDVVKQEIGRGEHERYISRNEFAKYLAEQDHPIREKEPVINGNFARLFNRVHILPQQREWNGALPDGIRKVPNAFIGLELRKPGAVLGVRDPSYYEVVVANPDTGEVLFSEKRGHPVDEDRILKYDRPWKGTEYRKKIRIPKEYAYAGSKLYVKDPELYQVKVHQVNPEVTIDFRGEPIPRGRWEKCLDDNGI